MKKIFKMVLPAALLIVFQVGCASLSEKGAAVRYQTKQEPPANCKMLPKTISSSMNVNQESMINSMRNDVGEAGGNLLVIDTMIVAESIEGTGRGFVCP